MANMSFIDAVRIIRPELPDTASPDKVLKSLWNVDEFIRILRELADNDHDFRQKVENMYQEAIARGISEKEAISAIRLILLKDYMLAMVRVVGEVAEMK